MPTAGTRSPSHRVPGTTCFVDVGWPVTLTWAGALRLAVPRRRPATRSSSTPGRRGVASSRRRAPPNAAELGLAATVEPGRPLTLEMTLAWVSLG